MTPDPAHKHIWNTIEVADLKTLNGDENVTMTSICYGDDTVTLLFDDESSYEFDNNCNVNTNHNNVTLTDLDGETITISCFTFTPVDFYGE